MTYTINVVKIGEELFEVHVIVNDCDVTVIDGITHVVTNDENIARDYAENVFLVDLKRNDKRLADLVLPNEVQEEESE